MFVVFSWTSPASSSPHDLLLLSVLGLENSLSQMASAGASPQSLSNHHPHLPPGLLLSSTDAYIPQTFSLAHLGFLSGPPPQTVVTDGRTPSYLCEKLSGYEWMQVGWTRTSWNLLQEHWASLCVFVLQILTHSFIYSSVEWLQIHQGRRKLIYSPPKKNKRSSAAVLQWNAINSSPSCLLFCAELWTK